MAQKKLTDIFVKAVQPPATGRVEYYDKHKTGLVLRVSARGVKSWSVFDRIKGGEKFRMTLGTFPVMTLAEARAATEKALEHALSGKDPRKVKADAEASEAERRANTVEDAAAKFIAQHAAKRRWGGEMSPPLLSPGAFHFGDMTRRIPNVESAAGEQRTRFTRRG